MRKVRVLSLDGGGIRGIIPATILEYIEKKLIDITENRNARIADYFDIIVGTSTGGILSCFYLVPNPTTNDGGPTSKYSAGQALKFYAEKGYDIFNKSKRNGWMGFRQIFNGTQYSPKNLEKILLEEFEDLKMNELLKPCIVTTYDLNSKTSFFFNSSEPEEKKRNFYVRDVVRSTSAAPTYFPPAHITNLATKGSMMNIDGGVFANNPTMCAYVECRKTIFPQVAKPGAKNMLILSIGTGGGQFDLPSIGKAGRWSVVKWAKSIPEIMMDGSVDTVSSQMRFLFETLDGVDQLNYKRIDVPLDKRKYSRNMSDASKPNIVALEVAAKEALNVALQDNGNEHGLDKFIELLVENAPKRSAT